MPETPLHRTLRRQLRNSELDPETPPETAEVWAEHLRRVSVAYEQADDDRYLSERSLQLSSTEMRALNDSLRDATEQRTAERDRLQMLVGALGDGVCAFDANARISVVNPEAERLFGLSADQLIGRDIHEFATLERLGDDRGAESTDLVRSVIGDLRTTHAERVRITISTGCEFVASLVLNGFEGNEGRGAVMVFRDITDLWQNGRADQALSEVARAVAKGKEVFNLVATATASIFSCEAMVCRFDEDDALVVGAEGVHSEAGDRLPTADGGALARVRATGGLAHIADFSKLPADSPLRAHALSEGYMASLAAPITANGRLWGAIVVTTKRVSGIDHGVDDRLGRFAELVGTAIANREARAELEALASTDPLTGFGNHRTFQERLSAELARARRAGTPLSLALIDIDRFKRINDEHGHQVGDRVLRLVTERIGRAAREGDAISRVGGDEIAWLLPGSDSHEAWQAVDRARERVSAKPIDAGLGLITLSAGVCDLSAARDADELLSYADGALYWAKNHGRDCVVRYTPDVVEVLSDAERAESLSRQQALQSIRVLARAVDAKDHSTRQHSERVADVAVQLAHVLGWDLPRMAQLREAGMVHDVGKISVPDSILFKPSRLTEVEIEGVRAHAAIGAEMVAGVLTDEQVAWIRAHHERWDGKGYPDGLAEEDIPEGARILTVADCWDVMTSYRPYSAPLPPDEAMAECVRCSGSQFWPDGVDALGRLHSARALVHEGALGAA